YGTPESGEIEAEDQADFLGYCLTHPYTEGYGDIAFSADNMAMLVCDDRIKLCLVQSGEALFLLARTLNTPNSLHLAGGLERFQAKFDEILQFAIDEVQDSGVEHPWQEALEITNLFFAKHLGMAYYRGRYADGCLSDVSLHYITLDDRG